VRRKAHQFNSATESGNATSNRIKGRVHDALTSFGLRKT
jgi:hypothetical protein